MKLSLLTLLFVFMTTLGFCQMNTYKEHNLVDSVNSITEYKIIEKEGSESIVKVSGADSTTFFFNRDAFVDSVHSFTSGTITNRVYFKYKNGKVT